MLQAAQWSRTSYHFIENSIKIQLQVQKYLFKALQTSLQTIYCHKQRFPIPVAEDVVVESFESAEDVVA